MTGTNGNKTIVHKFAFFVFIDPLYKDGWRERKDGLPENRDALHIGCGIVVKEDSKTITLALAEELYDQTSAVMQPLLLHKDCIIKYYTFTDEMIYEIFKGRTPKRIKDKIRKEIDFSVEDYC